MNQRPEESGRIIIYPKDIQRLTQRSLRTCRDMLQKARLALGLKPKDLVTYRDFCKVFSWDEDLVRKTLRSSFSILLQAALYLWIFRDDMDLAGNWIVVWVMLKLWKKDFKMPLSTIKGWFRK